MGLLVYFHELRIIYRGDSGCRLNPKKLILTQSKLLFWRIFEIELWILSLYLGYPWLLTLFKILNIV